MALLLTNVICIFSLAQITNVGVIPTFEHTNLILILGLLHKTIPACLVLVSSRFQNFHSGLFIVLGLRASTQTLSMWPYKSISHITVLLTNCFPTPPIKLKLGQRVEERLLIATHFDQSNYLANQKQGAVNKYDLTVFIRLFDGPSRALKSCTRFQGPSFLKWIHWIWLLNLIQHFQCRVTYWVGGDALILFSLVCPSLVNISCEEVYDSNKWLS